MVSLNEIPCVNRVAKELFSKLKETLFSIVKDKIAKIERIINIEGG